MAGGGGGGGECLQFLLLAALREGLSLNKLHVFVFCLTFPFPPTAPPHSHFFYLHLFFTMARTSTLFVAAGVALMALVSAAFFLPSPCLDLDIRRVC